MWSRGWRRRDFLAAAGIAIVSTWRPRAWQGSARADTAAAARPRYWLNIVPTGGIDPIWTTDPRTRRDVGTGVDVPYAPGAIAHAGQHRFGPHFARLAPHAGRLAVINGVLVRTANHYTGIEQAFRLRTRTTMRTPAIFDILGAHRDSQPLAHVCLNTPLRQGHTLDFFGTGVDGDFGGGADLLSRIESMGPEQMRELAGVLERELGSLRRQGALSPQQQKVGDSIAQVRAYLLRAADAPRFAPSAWLDGDLAGKEAETPIGAPLQRALWLIEHDMAAAITVGLTNFAWDTHSDNDSIQSALSPMFAGHLAALISALAERRNRHGSLIDQTAIVVGSEIGRFPYMNADRGKDHFPQIPVMLAGPPFAGGGSHAPTGRQMQALPTSLATGRTDDRASRLTLDDVGYTVLAAGGVRPELYGVAGRRLRFALAAGALAVIGALAACGGQPVDGRPAARPALDRARLDHASRLVRGRGIGDAEWRQWTGQRATASAIIDSMLDDPFLATSVAPTLLFRNNLLRPGRVIVIWEYLLERADIGGEPVLFYRDRCAARDVISVRPWWNLAAEVRVCRDAVRADVWETRLADGKVASCDSAIAAPRPGRPSACRCGPNLLRCVPMDVALELENASVRELRDTTAHVVASDLPLARLFSGTETRRERAVQLLYLRGIADGRRLADPEPLLRQADGWSGSRFAPRAEESPGQHAGVLTGPQLLYHGFDPRQRMRVTYEVMWCAGESAPGALPEDLLALHTPNLSTRNEGWRELAARPICTSCHARLDYGMQFFRRYPPLSAGPWHYAANEPAETGPLYGTSIDDPRDQGPLTPAGFARIAIAQPEFARCMARNVAEYVFGPRVTPAQVDRLVGGQDGATLRFRSLIRAALLELADCATCAVPGRDPVEPAAPPAPALAKLVGEHCTGCHHDGESIPSFEGTLDPATRARVIDQALFGRMPPGAPLPWSVRQQFIDAGRRGGGSSADRAAAFLAVRGRPPAALPLVVAREQIRQLAGGGAPPAPINAVEAALDGKDNVFTPSYAGITAVDAWERCRTTADPAGCTGHALRQVWNLEPTPR